MLKIRPKYCQPIWLLTQASFGIHNTVGDLSLFGTPPGLLHNQPVLRENYKCLIFHTLTYPDSNEKIITTKLQYSRKQVNPVTLFVVYWPSTQPNMPFQRRGSCIFHWRRRAWLTIWDKVKSHGTVRLMHRKGVTCELHDSYFRSMTIKHVIPRTAEVTHPDGQL